MVIYLHAKNQANICKPLAKSPENCLIAEIYSVQGFAKKSMERNKTQTWL